MIIVLWVVPQGSVIEDSEKEVTKVNEIVWGKKNTEVASQLLGNTSITPVRCHGL